MRGTRVRIDLATHQALKEAVALAVRRLRQDRMDEELTAALTAEDLDWLDACLG